MLAAECKRSLRPLLNTIDRIGELGTGISIPRIVVVGDQSSGKSSVLEAISGVALPQGTGTVTRCALVIQMKQSPSDLMKISWPGKDPITIEATEDIEKHVREATDGLTKGDLLAFSSEEIQLTIQGPDCPDLTLVDLPGIVRKPKDDQDASVVTQIRSLIRKHIEKEESIIAAVIPCGDLETSEALSLAKDFDPESNRTIGILTKPDLMDKGTHVKDILLGKEHSLKHGYIVVKNRGNQERNLSMDEARKEEIRFFKEHPVYGELSKNHYGVGSLVEKLQPLLKQTITKNLPNIQNKVVQELKEDEEELKSLGEIIPAQATNIAVMKFIDNIYNVIDKQLNGEVTNLDHTDTASVHIRNAITEFSETIHDQFKNFRSNGESFVGMKMVYSKKPLTNTQTWATHICKKVLMIVDGKNNDVDGKNNDVHVKVDDKAEEDGKIVRMVEVHLKKYEHQLTLVRLLQSRDLGDFFGGEWEIGSFKVVGENISNKIRKLMLSCNGPEPVGFPSRGPFYILMKEQIEKMQDPTQKLCEKVHTIIKDVVLAEIHRVMKPWPQMERWLVKSSEEHMEERYKKALEGMELELVKERTYFNTNNKYFYNTVNSIRQTRIEAAMKVLSDKSEDGKVTCESLKSIFKHGKGNEEEEMIEIADRVLAYYKVLTHQYPNFKSPCNAHNGIPAHLCHYDEG